MFKGEEAKLSKPPINDIMVMMTPLNLLCTVNEGEVKFRKALLVSRKFGLEIKRCLKLLW